MRYNILFPYVINRMRKFKKKINCDQFFMLRLVFCSRYYFCRYIYTLDYIYIIYIIYMSPDYNMIIINIFFLFYFYFIFLPV